MPITIEQIKQAQEKLNNVQKTASEVNEILVKVTEAILVKEDGSAIIELTAGQKTELLEQYNIRKQALISAANDLL